MVLSVAGLKNLPDYYPAFITSVFVGAWLLGESVAAMIAPENRPEKLGEEGRAELKRALSRSAVFGRVMARDIPSDQSRLPENPWQPRDRK